MKKAALLLITLTTLMSTWVNALPWTSEYFNGTDICARHLSERSGELPLWVSVPLDYQNPGKGHFPLYAWTKTPFDPDKKTVVFVSGGPGDTAHFSSMMLADWNLIFFDQRGNSCSRPPTPEQYLDRAFYSSENTARDIDEIRKALGVDKISVYGVSYGTVPAHIYASIFAERTRAVVLEGVIFQSDAKTLIENPRRRKTLQQYFNSLPTKTQDRILELSQNPDLPADWFSNVGKMMLYLDNPLPAFSQFLDNVIWNDDVLKSLLPSFEDRKPQDREFGFSQVMMNMIACKELGMNTPEASFSSVFVNRTLVPVRSNSLREKNCEPLGFKAGERLPIFKATNYPLQIPVTYFQGSLDGATPASQAVKSYKQAVQKSAHLVIVKNGGHIPLQGPLGSGFEPGPPTVLRQKALEFALEGVAIPSSLLAELSQVTGLTWTSISK